MKVTTALYRTGVPHRCTKLSQEIKKTLKIIEETLVVNENIFEDLIAPPDDLGHQ